MTRTVDVWSDIHCPWALIAVHRLRRARARLSADVVFVPRAWPLEWVNRRGTPRDILDVEVAALASHEPELFNRYSDPSWPSTFLPAFELVAAADRIGGAELAENVDYALRLAFFRDSVDVSIEAGLRRSLDIAREYQPGFDVEAVMSAWLTLDVRSDVVRHFHGLRLRWLAWGPREAPTLVLLHGLRSYAATFESLARRLSESWRCVALDARGRGGSDWDPRRDYHTGRYVSDLSQLVDRLGLERFVLLGHSMGGATAMVWAAENPGRLDALVVEDMLPGSSVAGEGADRIRREVAATPSGFADRAEAFAYWRRLRPAAPRAAIESRIHHTTRPAAPDTGGLHWIPDMAGIGAARLDPSRPPADLWPTIDRLPARTLIVCGADSDFTRRETLAEVCRINPGIAGTVIDGAGHYVHDDQPGLFADCVEAFLAEVRS